MQVSVKDSYTIEVLQTNHTLLNIIRWAIEEFESEYEIDLIGYTIPHPMETKGLVKIQLRREEDQKKEVILSIFKRGIEASKAVIHRIEKGLTE